MNIVQLRPSIVHCEKSHAEEVGRNIRTRDAATALGMGLTPMKATLQTFEQSIASWAWIVSGSVVCIFGVAVPYMLGNIGIPWLIATPEIERHRIAFLRAAKFQGLPKMLALYPDLEYWVDARNALSIAWMKWLGFSVEDSEVVGPLGSCPVRRFWRKG